MAQPTYDEKCKLFLLNTVTFGDKDKDSLSQQTRQSELYSDALALFSKNYPEVPNFEAREHYFKGDALYTETPGKATLDGVTFKKSLSMARSLSMALHEELDIDLQKCEHVSDIFHVEDIRASVFFDAHAFIFLAYEITLTYPSDTDSKALIQGLFKGRALYGNLGIKKLHEAHANYLTKKIHSFFLKNNFQINLNEINLKEDYTLPALFLPNSSDDLYDLFENEETKEQFESNQILTNSKKDKAVFHVGWNYTVAAGFSTETFITLLHLITACQGYYFTLLGLKSHYTQELKRVIENSDKLSSFHVKKAEGVQLAFAHTVSSFHEYKSRLYPKYREEVNNILSRWNCNEDVNNIKELIELDLQAKQKKNSERVESVLFILALFQIPGLISVFTASKELINSSLFLFGQFIFTITSLTIFFLILLKGKKRNAWLFLLFAAIVLIASQIIPILNTTNN
jgi:hypothetical protein